MSNEKTQSRRSILGGIALATSAAALAAACGTEEPTPSPMPTPTPDAGAQTAEQEDLPLLNALIQAEELAISAYTKGAGVIQSVIDDPDTSAEERAFSQLVLAVAGRFLGQHQDHSRVLAARVTELGGTPTGAQDYPIPANFAGTTLNVVKLAANEERNAAIAYNGVVKGLKAASNRFIAASIEGDETQHYVILNSLLTGAAATTSAIGANVSKVVPRSFVATVGSDQGLANVTTQPVNDNS